MDANLAGVTGPISRSYYHLTGVTVGHCAFTRIKRNVFEQNFMAFPLKRIGLTGGGGGRGGKSLSIYFSIFQLFYRFRGRDYPRYRNGKILC